MENAKLISALIEARRVIKNPAMDSENEYFNNKFASLKACFDAVVPALLDHGIVLTQEFQSDNHQCICITHLLHESGESISFMSPAMTPTKSDPQGWASASSYARRYGLMAVMSIVGEADDDGNAASESAFNSKQAKTRTRNAMLKAADENDSEALREATKDLNNDQRAELWGSFNKDQRRKLTECRNG